MKIKILLSLLLIAGFVMSQNNNQIPLIPYPLNHEIIDEEFNVTNKTMIVHDKEISDIAYFLQNELLKTKDISLSLSQNKVNNQNNTIILKTTNSDKNDESYSIQMTEKEIVIEGNSNKGVFNGIISLLQLIQLTESEDYETKLQCYNIYDAPQYEWRGLMLDESRHFFGVEKVKELLNWMAFYKLNKFHWHLTDAPGWRIEIKKYPKLAYVGGIGNQSNPYTEAQFYTQEEIKELVRYAAERQIEIIPEIDMPGHASAANRAYPEFSGGGTERFPDFTFNPGNEEVYTYLTDILEEVDALFPSQIIHLGADEVSFGRKAWEENTEIQNLIKRENLADLDEVEKYFHNRMADSLILRNNKVAGWDEIANFDIAKDHSIVFYWRSLRPHMLQKAIDNDYPVVLCPNRVFYLDYRQDSTHVKGWQKHINSSSKIYNFTPKELEVTYKEDTNIMGIQANLWTEIISTNERLDFMTFPRIAALAETCWNSEDNKDFDKYNGRLKGHIDLFRKRGVYFYNPFDPDENKEPMQ